MFVQEEKIFAGKVLRLHICAADGTEWLEEASEDTSVEKLKERCLKHVRPGPAPPPRLGVGLRTRLDLGSKRTRWAACGTHVLSAPFI